MNKQLDKAAMNHTTTRLSTPHPPSQGRMVYHLDDEGRLQMRVTNSGVSYKPEELETFGEMIQVLRAEGQLGDSGNIPIANLLKM